MGMACGRCWGGFRRDHLWFLDRQIKQIFIPVCYEAPVPVGLSQGSRDDLCQHQLLLVSVSVREELAFCAIDHVKPKRQWDPREST